MEQLYRQLLFSDELNIKTGHGDPMGSYNPMQFVLRLRKDIHLKLQLIESGVRDSGSNTPEQYQAFSTYLHETIHWWQYMGSNFGFISSLRFPSQTHAVLKDLQEVLQRYGAFKSIAEYLDQQTTTFGDADPIINRIINYWYDLEAAGSVSFDPVSIKYYLEIPFYVSIGHSAFIMYSTAINSLTSTVDKDFSFLPDASKWAKEFKILRDAKVMWHDPESESIHLPSFGTKAIFEGQARLSQLQYLYFVLDGKYQFQDFKAQGFLDGIYVEALDNFLDTLKEKLPANPHDPLIGLFLLVCDIAINPTDGFPFNIEDFPSFVVSIDPGIRFRLLCIIIRDKFPFLKESIVHYSKKEYVALSFILCFEMKCRSPHESAKLVTSWATNQSAIITLLQEEKQFKFQETNLPVRLFLSKYIRFNQDKYEQPQIFCWPGASLIGLATNLVPLSEIEAIFNRHNALFINGADDNVYAAAQEGIDDQQLDETLNQFYSWNSVYGMVAQWINATGPFEYNLKWLSNKFPPEDAKEWVCNTFLNIFGHHPDTFKIL